MIEVAETAIAYDRAVKRALYAQHRIPEFWIFDVNGRAIEVHRDPSPTGYAFVESCEEARMLAFPDVPINVREVLE